jgi:hypothetical protein
MRLKVLLFVCVLLVNALATNPAKPETPRLRWLFSPGIVDELMVHTAVPEATARLIFEETRKAQLRDLARLKDVPVRTALDGDGYGGSEWFSYMVFPDRHVEIFKIWNDSGWQKSGDIDWTVMATETITFYSDHWEQVNANGIFFGKIVQ